MIDAMKKGLEVIDMLLEDYIPETTDEDADSVDIATEALRQAIAEAEKAAALQEISDIGQKIEQEPVAWMYHDGSSPDKIPSDMAGTIVISRKRNAHYKNERPLVFGDTAPPKREWQGLTDEDIAKSANTYGGDPMREFARAIEAKLREKNNGN